MNITENYHFQVGAMSCVAINDGTEMNPIESVVKGVAPEELRQALVERGESPTEAVTYFNVLYIRADRHRILVDAGWGQGTQRRDGALLDRLQAEGIALGDVDLIVLTHEDVDHIGGIVGADHRLVFPNATYVLPQEAWDFWSNEPLVAKWPPFLTDFARSTLPAIRDRLQIVAPGAEFLPGFSFIPAPGHRPGHAAVAVASSGEHLIHLADIVGHPILMEHPSWPSAYDAVPAQGTRDKSGILAQAVSQQALLFGSHLPFPGVGRSVPLGDGWRWQPLAE